MRCRGVRLVLVGCLLGLMAGAAPVLAGGPLIIFDRATQTPFFYPGTVEVYTDIDSLFSLTGPVTKASADARVAFGFAEWTNVPTATFSATMAGDFDSIGLPNITLVTAELVIGEFNGGGYHVIYDHDGSLTAAFAGPGVLGFSTPEFADSVHLTESYAVLNGQTVSGGDTEGLAWQGVITHEFGHGINLAHTQTNGAIGFFGDAIGPTACTPPYGGLPRIADLETMYPFLDPRVGGTGVEQGTVELIDDVSALSDIYPAPGWPGDFATISGRIFLSNGIGEITGVNVIARNLANPFGDCNSMLSGAFTQGGLGPDGRFVLNGLTPGADYVLYVDQIVLGGFSTPPARLPGPEEFWNGAGESGDPEADIRCEFTTITPVAGSPFTANVIFNFQLALGDDDVVEVPLPFTFTFCENDYTSVFVGSNGFLTFGTGDTSFFESVLGLLAGPPRIAALWDDLNPAAGGSVSAEEIGDDFVITFSNIPEFIDEGANTFSFTLRRDGTFGIDYGVITAIDGLAGRTEGNGVPDPGPTDLSIAPQPIGTGLGSVYEIFDALVNDLAFRTLEFDLCDPFEVVLVPAQPGVLYGSTGASGGELFTIDPATGGARLIGKTGHIRVPGLAINSAGEIFGSTGGGAPLLIRISALDAASQIVGGIRDSQTSVSLTFVDAIAFDAEDILYAIDGTNTLWTIDTSDGLATRVGFTGISGAPFLVGMAFQPGTGIIFASTGGLGGADQIYRIDPGTGLANLVGNTRLGRGAIPDLHFIDETLYGVKSPGGQRPFNLITINPATAVGTIVGTTGFRISGLAASQPLVTANLDIKPGSCPNPLNLKLLRELDGQGNSTKGGSLPVAVVGSDDFDVTQIVRESIRLEGVAPREKGGGFRDVSELSEVTDCDCAPRSKDGITDLVLHFPSGEVARAIASGGRGEEREVKLTGQLVDGTRFEASDCIKWVGFDANASVGAAVGLPALNDGSPNPFNPTTRIGYSLPQTAHVTVSIYDVKGRLIERLVSAVQSAGRHVIEWDARGLASGVYFYRLEVGHFSGTRKLILLK